MKMTIKTEERMQMLLSNFRLNEAIDIIKSELNQDGSFSKENEYLIKLIERYIQVISGLNWQEEGIHKLEELQSEEMPISINNELKRIISLIKEWNSEKKYGILYFVSAYYAIANLDSTLLQESLDKIEIELEAGNEESNVIYDANALLADIKMPLGGYERFELIANEIKKVYNLSNSAYTVLEKLSITIN